MNIMEISEKELVVEKISVNQLNDEMKQIKTGLLYALEAVECAISHCEELKLAKEVSNCLD